MIKMLYRNICGDFVILAVGSLLIEWSGWDWGWGIVKNSWTTQINLGHLILAKDK